MRLVRLLILEDDLETVSLLLKHLGKLQDELETLPQPKTFSVVVLSEGEMVDEYINQGTLKYDIVLLDRDDKNGGSFHSLDLTKIDPTKVISISSIPPYNDEAVKNGVKKAVWKDFQNLDSFTEEVINEVRKISLDL